MYFIGIDIGSTCAKTVVLGEDLTLLFRQVRPTGWSGVEAAENIFSEIKALGYLPDQASPSDPLSHPGAGIVATGYGRVSVPYADKAVTEITCHAAGAARLFGQGDLEVIDIGGQDTKIVRVKDGKVMDFIMNDKCSAGTGRFLEVMGNTMGLKPGELCELAREGQTSGTKISSMCTVFAESEVISLIGRGTPKANIAYAVVDSIADKVASQCRRLHDREARVILTGGLCECDFLREILERKLSVSVSTGPEGRYAGALGAALKAAEL